MTAPETGLKIPGRVAAPDDVTALADEVFTRGRKFGQSYRDMIAEAIMADRAARLASLEAERARTVEECARIAEQFATDKGTETAHEPFEAGMVHHSLRSGQAIRALASEKGQVDG